MDIIDQQKRSLIMAAVHSSGNRSTERKLRAYLIRFAFCGWEVHPSHAIGKPDFIFRKKRLAIFVDGCFWHGCPKCCRLPATRVKYWHGKIRTNIKRDHKIVLQLRKDGWKVLRVWEHELKKSPLTVLRRIRKLIGQRAIC